MFKTYSKLRCPRFLLMLLIVLSMVSTGCNHNRRNQPVEPTLNPSTSVVAAPEPVPTFTPIPAVRVQPTDTPVSLELKANATPNPTSTPKPQVIPVTNGPSNLRRGPGTNFSLSGQLETGVPVRLIARNSDETWLQLESGLWIWAQLVDHIPSGLPVATVPLTPTDTPRPASTPIPVAVVLTVGQGQHRVGIDVKPGLYRSDGGAWCYWERSSGMSGEISQIIANANPDGQTYVEIVGSDVAFMQSGCTPFVEVTEELKRTLQPPPNSQYGPGQYLVGVEVQSGLYRSDGGEWCYWERTSGMSGEISQIIANANPDGQTYVEIAGSDAAFMQSGCAPFVEVTEELKRTLQPPPNSQYGPGQYLVGVEVQSGLYRSDGGEWCYWERTSGMSGEFRQIIANANPDGQTYVEIAGSDAAFMQSGCASFVPESR